MCVAGRSPNSAAPAVCPSPENVTPERHRKERAKERRGEKGSRLVSMSGEEEAANSAKVLALRPARTAKGPENQAPGATLTLAALRSRLR